jgi:NAD(P)-dependent dehydrogenase (short-subunit alcohol dehydrogenase family)
MKALVTGGAGLIGSHIVDLLLQKGYEGSFIDIEILVKAHRLGARIKQVDVPHYPRVAGKATGAGPRAMAKTFLDLFRLWHRLRSAPSAASPVAGGTNQHPASSVT